MKVKVPLLLAAMILLAIAPAAMADHCRFCSPSDTCVIQPNWGFAECYYDAVGCHVDYPCGRHPAWPVAPLASEFTVAAVERLDEPQTAAPETLVAVAATPAPSTR